VGGFRTGWWWGFVGGGVCCRMGSGCCFGCEVVKLSLGFTYGYWCWRALRGFVIALFWYAVGVVLWCVVIVLFFCVYLFLF